MCHDVSRIAISHHTNSVHSSWQELETVNAKLAKACVSGALDKNPFIQGLLLQCLNKLEKEGRGVMSMTGRACKMSETEVALLENAALTLAVAGGNKLLCEQLMQKVTPPKIRLEELAGHGLPNPALALMYPDQLCSNLELVDNCYPRKPTSKSRRLVCAVDATYLLKSLVQFSRDGQAGLVGAAWSMHNEANGFLELEQVGKCKDKAPLMLEFLLWNPCSVKKETFSVAAMPVSLKACPSTSCKTLSQAGNWATWRNRVCSSGLERTLFI